MKNVGLFLFGLAAVGSMLAAIAATTHDRVMEDIGSGIVWAILANAWRERE